MRALPGLRLMARRETWLATIALLVACGTPGRIADPIDGVPSARQATISRTQLGFRWPLAPGVGTLACGNGGVILFRTGGVTYVVQGEGAAAADITPIRLREPSAPPSNPLKRLTQDVRMEAFASLQRCRSSDGEDACSRSVQSHFTLSADDVRLIEAEGQERRWPPLARGLMPLDALTAAGRALCEK